MVLLALTGQMVLQVCKAQLARMGRQEPLAHRDQPENKGH